MKNIIATVILSFLIVTAFSQNSHQIVVNITAPECCPTFGQASLDYGVHGEKDVSPPDDIWTNYLGPQSYPLTFIYPFSQQDPIMTHAWCRTDGKQGICGYMSGQMVTCRDETAHEVYLSTPSTQQFYLHLQPHPEPTANVDPPPED